MIATLYLSTFTSMRKYTKSEIDLMNIQIGSMLRLARLQKGLSQLDLALSLEFNATLIGRIERSEGISGWDKILLIAQKLDIDICDLFELKKKTEILNVLEQALQLEEKLTEEKRSYYEALKNKIIQF